MSKFYNLHTPSYEKLKAEIMEDLHDAFEVLHCDVVVCPDLSQEPFSLSAQGLCGNPILVDVGGIRNLLPTPNLDAKFDLTDAISDCEIPNGFICGAGAGPFYEIGTNCEIIADAKYEEFKVFKNKSMLAKIINNENISFPAKSTKFGIIGQFLCCKGETGRVLKITAERRKKDGSIIDFIHDSLNKHYGSENQAVGLGGVILTQCGEVKIHVMPDFSKCPLNTDSKVEDWLHFFHVTAPFVAVGEMVSHDPLNLGLRLEHFHGFSADRNKAGHFHQDVTPEIVKYICYFVIGEKLLRKAAC